MKKLKPYADFLFEVGALNRTPRSGFRHLGDWKQSVSEHLLRTAYVGYVLAHFEKEKDKKIDVNKVVLNCLFHDLGEARALDLDYISQKYSTSDELMAIRDATKNLSFGKNIENSFIETEIKQTKEGIIAKDADQIELILSLKEIIDHGSPQAKDWIGHAVKRLKTNSGKKLAKEILRTNSNDWWFGDRNDTYWVTGGKNRKPKK